MKPWQRTLLTIAPLALALLLPGAMAAAPGLQPEPGSLLGSSVPGTVAGHPGRGPDGSGAHGRIMASVARAGLAGAGDLDDLPLTDTEERTRDAPPLGALLVAALAGTGVAGFLMRRRR